MFLDPATMCLNTKRMSTEEEDRHPPTYTQQLIILSTFITFQLSIVYYCCN